MRCPVSHSSIEAMRNFKTEEMRDAKSAKYMRRAQFTWLKQSIAFLSSCAVHLYKKTFGSVCSFTPLAAQQALLMTIYQSWSLCVFGDT